MTKANYLRPALLTLGALAIAQSAPAVAQSAEVRDARSQVEWTLGNLDQMMDEQHRNERAWNEVEREERRLQSISSNLGWTISNYNMNCTRAGTVANQCGQWGREIDRGNRELEEGFAEVNRRYQEIDRRQRELQSRVDQMRMRLMDNTRRLASACRNATVDARGNLCSMPSGGRNAQGFANEAENVLRASL